MRKIYFNWLVILWFIPGIANLQAQNSTLSAGGNAASDGGKVSYSVGQIAYQNLCGTSGRLIQGVQQPYEISVVSGIKETEEITFSIKTYPNPTSDYLFVTSDLQIIE